MVSVSNQYSYLCCLINNQHFDHWCSIVLITNQYITHWHLMNYWLISTDNGDTSLSNNDQYMDRYWSIIFHHWPLSNWYIDYLNGGWSKIIWSVTNWFKIIWSKIIPYEIQPNIILMPIEKFACPRWKKNDYGYIVKYSIKQYIDY